jgi:uncharacterized protein YqjF (DUF2071 family)
MPGDFNHRIFDEVGHRPWPMPAEPWVMTQTWNDLLFAHWRVAPSALRPHVPEALALDVWEDGSAWLGVVAFHMTNVGLRACPPIPGLSAFPELNLRTYVRVGNVPGVYFFSLDASSTLAVLGARTLLRLPYRRATMHVERRDGTVHYESEVRREPQVRFAATYKPVGPTCTAAPGTLEHFLTERYCLLNTLNSQWAYRLDIHHPPWPLQPAVASIGVNTLAAVLGIDLPSDQALLHYARRQDMVAWLPARAAQGGAAAR